MADVKAGNCGKNVYYKIVKRSITGASCRQDLGILRTLMSGESNNFTKTWSQTSRNPIHLDYHYLFFDKLRTVYNTNGTKGKPLQIYKLPTLHKKEKIESAVYFESPLDQGSLQECKKNDNFRPCVVGITADGFLIRQDVRTGEKLQAVYLSTKYKFKHICWDNDLRKVVLSSVHAKTLPMPTRDNRTCVFRTLMYLALFEITPLRFIATIPILKNIFGYNIVDASINNDILFIMHKGGFVKMYSLKEVLDRFTTKTSIGQLYNFTGNNNDQHDVSISQYEKWGAVGEYPFGIPVNVKFDQIPSLLLQVCSHQHLVSFGGFPWHYIICPRRQNSVFEVFTMKNEKPVKNGYLQSSIQSLEQDQAYFHKDNSGRILHIGPDFIRYLKLNVLHNECDNQTFDLQTCYTLPLKQLRKQDNTTILFTSSGRRIKPNNSLDYQNPGYESVRDIDFEDELDILVVLSSQDDQKGHIGLYDNQTGSLLKEIHLDYWEDDSDHSINMELDTVVHIFKRPSRNYICEVFKFVCK